MPTKRRPLRRDLRRRITPEVVAAWQAADYRTLHCALGLRPWEASPLPREITALGVHPGDERPDSELPWDQSKPVALELQRQLLAIAGWPACRDHYLENLRDAEEMARYYQELVDDPERGGQGTGSDPVSRRRDLQRALEEVAYRKALLDGLDD